MKQITLISLMSLFCISAFAGPQRLDGRTSKKDIQFSSLCFQSLEVARTVLDKRQPVWPGMSQYRGDPVQGVSAIKVEDDVIRLTYLQEEDLEKAIELVDEELDLNLDQHKYDTFEKHRIGRTIEIPRCRR